MERKLYEFNSSQDVIKLQTKYSLFNRVANIVFSTEIDAGFDKKLMAEAIDIVIERNDCLRIKFIKKDGKTFQYFEETRKIGGIPEIKFNFEGEKVKFLNGFRKKGLNVFKGETLKVVFATEVSGKQSIYFKISHYVADTYGIGVIVSDLLKVYEAMKEGKELPAAPGSFESVLQKDIAYKNNTELKAKDEEFFKDYYEGRHPEHPVYCGLHGNGSDRWMKEKKKGHFSMPYLFVRCDTEGYHFTIPAAIGAKAKQWCTENEIPLSTFYFTTCNIAASIVNDKEERLSPLMLLDCRGTMSERKAAGTKVQAISVYTQIDYNKSFSEIVKDAFADQNELYKHTRLTYLEVEAIQHKLWNYSMLSQVNNYAFSYIPMDAPDGVKFQIHSNGKGALTGYIALMASSKTDEIDVVYDVQKLMITGPQLAEFQNTYTRVIESVLNDSTKKLNDLF